MKRTSLFYCLLAFASLAIFTACSNDDDENKVSNFSQDDIIGTWWYETDDETIFVEFRKGGQGTETVEEPEEPIDKSVVIHGYAGSTAQAYAEKYNRKFEVIEEEIPQTTTATTTATVETTTTTTASSTTTTTATTVETTTVTTEKPTEDVVPEFVKGDANGDGKMTIADAVSLSNWIMGVSDAKLENSEAADLCKDGKIDVFDLCLLREELVK